jgi:hypothetical protein
MDVTPHRQLAQPMFVNHGPSPNLQRRTSGGSATFF